MCISASTKEIRRPVRHNTHDTWPVGPNEAIFENRTGMDMAESGLGNVALSPALPIHALTNDRDIEPESATEPCDQNSEVVRSEQETHNENNTQPPLHHAVPPPQPANTRPRDNNPQLPPFGPPPLHDFPPSPSNRQSGSDELSASPSNHPQVASYFERRILPPPRPTHALLPRRATLGNIFDRRLVSRLDDRRADSDPLYHMRTSGNSTAERTENQTMLVDRIDPGLPLATPFALEPSLEGMQTAGPNALTFRYGQLDILSDPRSRLDLQSRRPRSSPGPDTAAGLRRFGAPAMTPISGLSSSTAERAGLPYASTSYPDYQPSSLRSLEDSSSLHDHTRRMVHRRGSSHSTIHGHTQSLFATPYPSTSTRQATQLTRGESSRRPSVIEREFALSRSVSEDEQPLLNGVSALTPPRRSGIGRSVKSTRMGMACVICRKR